MKKILSILLILTMVLSLGVTAFAEGGKDDPDLRTFLSELSEKDEVTEEDLSDLFNLLGNLISREVSGEQTAETTNEITSKDMTFYLNSLEDVRTYTVYFMGDSDVSYFSLEDWGELMTYLMHTYVKKGQDISFDLSFSMEGETGMLLREDGFPALFDCADDIIYIWDYDAFQRPDADRLLIDILEADSPGAEEGVKYFQRCAGSYERYGRDLTLDLGAYGIDMVAHDGCCYVPIQTLSDILLAIHYMNVYYNGEDFYIAELNGLGTQAGEFTPLGEKFHSAEMRDRSEAMGEFSYRELCLAMDSLYGLKEVHGFESFDLLCRQAGCDLAMKGRDAWLADDALFQIIMYHLNDGHSSFVNCSPMATSDSSYDAFVTLLKNHGGYASSMAAWFANSRQYKAVRAEFYPEDVPNYEEVGNTAYITFDHFTDIPEGVDYYETAPTAEVEDTIGIILYAYSQIMREDSPIENVVLDLSLNGGGSSDAAIFVVSAFLGQGSVSQEDTLTGAMATGLYKVDVNLDRQFDEQDLGLTEKNLFCLISPCSFSCGNLVPNVFKNTGKVILLGRTSGGGSCFVMPLSTAYGTDFRISSPLRMSFAKNGSFYDIDRGAEPDFSLARLSTFYDRAALTDYINTLP